MKAEEDARTRKWTGGSDTKSHRFRISGSNMVCRSVFGLSVGLSVSLFIAFWETLVFESWVFWFPHISSFRWVCASLLKGPSFPWLVRLMEWLIVWLPDQVILTDWRTDWLTAACSFTCPAHSIACLFTRLLRRACFTRALHCARSFARSLSPSFPSSLNSWIFMFNFQCVLNQWECEFVLKISFPWLSLSSVVAAVVAVVN